MDRAALKDNLQAFLLIFCCFMLSWEIGCNLVASKASYNCVISKQWSFSGSEGHVFGHRLTGSHSFIAKDVRAFQKAKKAAETKYYLKFAGDDKALHISVCVSVSLRFRFPT